MVDVLAERGGELLGIEMLQGEAIAKSERPSFTEKGECRCYKGVVVFHRLDEEALSIGPRCNIGDARPYDEVFFSRVEFDLEGDAVLDNDATGPPPIDVKGDIEQVAEVP